MEMISVPGYEDLFDGPIPPVDTLLEGIPSQAVLFLLASANAELLLSQSEANSQLKILNAFLRRNPSDIQAQILRRVSLKAQENDQPSMLFGTNYILAFMHYELRHFRRISIDDTTPQQELSILKAYFYFVSAVNASAEKVFEDGKALVVDHFYKYSWPLLVDQLDAHSIINPMTEMVRGMAFFNFLEHHSPYASAVKTFLEKRKQPNAWNYVFQLLEIIQHMWSRPKDDFWNRAQFSVADVAAYQSLLETFVIDVENYRHSFPEDSDVLTGLKDSPIYQYNEELYIVLNWNFFANKIYEGLLFDFYRHSGIAIGTPFKTFPNFKQYLSEQVTEGFLFKRVLSQTLRAKHSVLAFDNKVTTGFPDAYYRRGNNLMLFEIKDAYFPSKAIQSRSYTGIKEAIDTKYNQRNKGVGQLIRQLDFLRNGSYELPMKYKHSRNFRVYPVIVYTDHYFGMPGINRYLNEEFESQLKKSGLDQFYRQVKPLTLISIRFFINYIHLLQREGMELHLLLNAYHQYLERKVRKHERLNMLEDYFNLHQPFGRFFVEEFGVNLHKQSDYARTIVDALDLTQGLSEV